MNIFNYGKQIKQRAMDYREKKQEERAIRTAGELKDLKKRRIALEGREKIYRAEDKEKTKLNKAKMNLRKRTPSYRVVHAMKEQYKKHKSRGSSFGALPGGNFSSGSGVVGGFSLGQDKPKAKPRKAKRRSIRIEY